MHRRYWSIAAIACAALVAGCVEGDEDESRADGNARHFTVDVPAGATELHVDVSGSALEGEPDVTVLIEDENGNNLATDTWSLRESTERRVTADVAGISRAVVTVRVVDGDADLDVRVSATVPSEPSPVVIIRERVVIVQVVQPTPPPSPTGATPPTPSPSPTPTPTPSPTPPTNTTNTTNTTG